MDELTIDLQVSKMTFSQIVSLIQLLSEELELRYINKEDKDKC